jgi:Uma2 family endonuclease
MAVQTLITPPMPAQLEPRRFNVTEYYLMAAAGILTSDERVELIEGEVITMSAIGSPHAACVSRLVRMFITNVGNHTTIWPQNPVRLNDFSEPVPDIAVLKSRSDHYSARHPLPEDVLLLIEVADTTPLKDRNVKIPLYARSGIREVWLVNLPEKLVEVYSALEAGQYNEPVEFKSGDVIKLSFQEGYAFAVDEILGIKYPR